MRWLEPIKQDQLKVGSLRLIGIAGKNKMRRVKVIRGAHIGAIVLVRSIHECDFSNSKGEAVSLLMCQRENGSEVALYSDEVINS